MLTFERLWCILTIGIAAVIVGQAVRVASIIFFGDFSDC